MVKTEMEMLPVWALSGSQTVKISWLRYTVTEIYFQPNFLPIFKINTELFSAGSHFQVRLWDIEKHIRKLSGLIKSWLKRDII